MKFQITPLIALFSLIALGCASVETPISLDESKFDLLSGRWAGKLEERGGQGSLYRQDSVVLEVSRETPTRGRFSMGGASWETTIAAKEGKVVVVVGIDRESQSSQ